LLSLVGLAVSWLYDHIPRARCREEWAKKRPFFSAFTFLFFGLLDWGVQMEFAIQNEINSFHLFCNTIRLL